MRSELFLIPLKSLNFLIVRGQFLVDEPEEVILSPMLAR